MNKYRLIRIIKRRLWFFNRSFALFGKKSIIESPLIIIGKKYIKIEKNVNIYKNSRIECIDNYANCKLSPNLIIREGTIIGYNFQCLVTDNCVIGKNCLFASNVFMTTENHGMDPNVRYVDQPLINNSVHIGDNVWIGDKVTILPGTVIGNNCIIGANSLVNSCIPDNCIAVGSPAKVIKIYDFEKKDWMKI